MDCFTQKPQNSHITLQIGTELSTQVVFCAARSKHNHQGCLLSRQLSSSPW